MNEFRGNKYNVPEISPQDKIVGSSQLKKIAKKNGFETFEDLKKFFGVNSKRDAFWNKNGELYFKAKNFKGESFEAVFTNIFK